MGRRTRKVARLAVALGLGSAGAAAVGECAVRIWIPEPVLPRFVVDAGYGVRDNARNVRTTHSTPGEYQVEISTNAAGLRGRVEYSLEKPQGTYRVALLGDSFVFGYGVPDDEVVSSMLSAELGARPGVHETVEVLNFAVAGFGQAEELVTYRNKVRAYSPDLVVVFYFDNDIGNDAVSGLFRLAPESGALERTAASYLPGVRARELLYSAPPVRFLFEHSQLWNLVRNRLSRIVQGRLLDDQGLASFDDATPAALELHHAIFLELLDEIRRDACAAGVFVIPLRTLRSNFSLDRETLSARCDFVLDGRELLLESDYYTRDGHWRPSGHAKAALGLSRAIRKLRLTTHQN